MKAPPPGFAFLLLQPRAKFTLKVIPFSPIDFTQLLKYIPINRTSDHGTRYRTLKETPCQNSLQDSFLKTLEML